MIVAIVLLPAGGIVLGAAAGWMRRVWAALGLALVGAALVAAGLIAWPPPAGWWHLTDTAVVARAGLIGLGGLAGWLATRGS